MGKAYDDLKKRIKKMSKNLKKTAYGKHSKKGEAFKRGGPCNNGGGWPPGGSYPPFFKAKSPRAVILLSPRAFVLYAILVVLLLCGVSLYGIVVLILLAIIFVLI